MNGMGWTVVACLLADDTVLFAESEEELQRMNSCKWSEVWCNGLGEKKYFEVVWSSSEKEE